MKEGLLHPAFVHQLSVRTRPEPHEHKQQHRNEKKTVKQNGTALGNLALMGWRKELSNQHQKNCLLDIISIHIKVEEKDFIKLRVVH